MENHDDPYCLHSSNHLVILLVSQYLTGDNFNSSRHAMLMALDGKNTTGFLNGTFPKPEDHSPQYRSWMCNNNNIPSWLFNVVSKEISASDIYAANLAEI
ncbi:unnamed protein product [Lathyrus oleraceus]